MTSFSAADLKQRFDAARAQLEQGDVNGAAEAFDRLAQQAPGVAAIAVMQGLIATRLGFHDTAITHLTRADSLQPDDPATLKALVGAQEAAGQGDAALTTFDRLIRLSPKSPEWHSEKALFLQRVGKFDAAARILRRAIKKMPDQAFMYRMLTQTEKLKPADPLVREMRKRIDAPLTSAAHKAQFGYAMAKVMADLGKHDRVFPYLHVANTAERKTRPFDYAAFHDEIWTLIRAQDVTDFPVREDAHPDVTPIFLIGPPRSGTTLIERVLGAHPQAHGIGEAGLATRGISVLMGRHKAYTPLSAVPSDKVAGYRRAYERHALRQAGATSGALVDKTMHLFWIMGAIRHAMPAARFVVIDRDPRDVAVSIYRNMFSAGSHHYSNDLGDIARYLHDFRKGVAHWEQRLPEAPYRLSYDAFVADPEPQTRALVKAVGLPWDDACLRPHEAAGAVKTLSLHQVRQPIYKTSARGWTRYADDLKPFDDMWEQLNAAD